MALFRFGTHRTRRAPSWLQHFQNEIQVEFPARCQGRHFNINSPAGGNAQGIEFVIIYEAWQ